MALQRLTALALVSALALGVSACGDDSPSPAPSTSSAAASATPTPSSSGPAAPVLPELAARRDDVGAKAFIRFYFEALTYAMRTGETEVVRRISLESCGTCSRLLQTIEATYEEGDRLAGRGWAVVATRSLDERTDGEHVYAFVEQFGQTQLDASGTVVRRAPRKNFGAGMLVVWESDGWTVREIAVL